MGIAIRGSLVALCAALAPARPQGDPWVAPRALRVGEAAFVRAGGVRDAYGDFNGEASPLIVAGGPPR